MVVGQAKALQLFQLVCKSCFLSASGECHESPRDWL